MYNGINKYCSLSSLPLPSLYPSLYISLSLSLASSLHSLLSTEANKTIIFRFVPLRNVGKYLNYCLKLFSIVLALSVE